MRVSLLVCNTNVVWAVWVSNFPTRVPSTSAVFCFLEPTSPQDAHGVLIPMKHQAIRSGYAHCVQAFVWPLACNNTNLANPQNHRLLILFTRRHTDAKS